MPLILNIPPPAERALASAAFVKDVEAKGNATDSGLIGASYVLQALVEAGRPDIALSMAMRETYPSWVSEHRPSPLRLLPLFSSLLHNC